MAGQGDPGPLPDHVTHLGALGVKARGELLEGAIASLRRRSTASRSRGGRRGAALRHAVHHDGLRRRSRRPSRQSGAAARTLTTSTSVQLAANLTLADRKRIRQDAIKKYSLEAVFPQYLRYFKRLHDQAWGKGYYETSREWLEVPR